MSDMLKTRLAKLESKVIPKEQPRRIIRLVASQDEHDAAVKLAIAEGYNPDSNDIAIIRLIVPAPGSPGVTRPPCVTSKSWE